MKDLRDERHEAANRLRWMVPECGAYPLGEIGSAIMGGSFTVSELRDRLIWLLSGDMGEDGKTPVEDANGTAGAAAASESGLSWLDSAALAECRRLTAENAALTERNAELRAALDEQGDELARVRREAASVPTELDGGRLLIVADSIASDGEGLRTIEAYGRFFEREDGSTAPDPYYYVKLPLDADGKPWNIGDMVDGHGKVHGMGLDMFGWHFVNVDNAINPELYRHAKPRTLEDATRDFVNSVITCNGSRDGIPVVGIDDSLWRDCFDTFAEEMRELLEVE